MRTVSSFENKKSYKVVTVFTLSLTIHNNFKNLFRKFPSSPAFLMKKLVFIRIAMRYCKHDSFVALLTCFLRAS